MIDLRLSLVGSRTRLTRVWTLVRGGALQARQWGRLSTADRTALVMDIRPIATLEHAEATRRSHGAD